MHSSIEIYCNNFIKFHTITLEACNYKFHHYFEKTNLQPLKMSFASSVGSVRKEQMFFGLSLPALILYQKSGYIQLLKSLSYTCVFYFLLRYSVFFYLKQLDNYFQSKFYIKHWTVIVLKIHIILDGSIKNQTDFVMMMVEIIETLRLIKSAIFRPHFYHNNKSAIKQQQTFSCAVFEQ